MDNGNNLHKTFERRLQDRGTRSAKRRLTITDKNAVDFSSNDFLSLSQSTQLRSEYLKQLQKAKHMPLGSGGSRLLDGNSRYVEQLEQGIADFHDAPCGLIFNSGFDANAALFSCVPQPGDVVLYDEFVHASVHEGMRLSRARTCAMFAHNCMSDFSKGLKKLMKEHPPLVSGEANLFVAVETVYSMDGDLAPLQAIVDQLREFFPLGNGHLVVDEAHSTGVFGTHGRGIVHQLGLQKHVLARLHTFGKALSSTGAIVLCSPIMREYLINYARSLIYTTALGLPSLAMVLSAYRLMRRGATVHAQAKLWRLINHFHAAVRSLPSTRDFQAFPDPPTSPIFALQTTQPRSLASYCQDAGFVVRPVVHPTVPKGTERVRVCLHSGNTAEEVDKLVATVRIWLETQQLCHTSERPTRARL